MSFPFPRKTLALWLSAAGAVLLVLLVSFLPPTLKVELDTRGPWHAWGHLYTFMGLFLLLCQCGDTARSGLKTRLWIGCACLLLGLGIEGLQAGGRWAELEWSDLACNSLGVLTGVLIVGLRGAGVATERVPRAARLG